VVLRLLAAGQEMGVRLTDLAASSGLNRATLHRILRVLVDEGAVEQDPQTRRYMIGPEVSLFGLARTARFPIRGPEDEARQVIAENGIRLQGYRLDGDAVAEQVRMARAQGFTYAPNGIVRGTRAVAVAVLDPAGHAIAAISIAGMANRLTAARLPQIVCLLQEQTASLRLLLSERARRRTGASRPSG